MYFPFGLTSKYDLEFFKNIYIPAAPPSIKYIKFDSYVPNDFYLNTYFMEFKVGVETDQKIYLRINTQEKLKQFGLRHHVSITVNAAQG